MTKAGMVSDEMIWLNMGQWPCYFGFTTSELAFKKVMKRLNADANDWISLGANATTHFLTKDGDNYKGQENTYIICIHPFKQGKVTREQYAAMIAHEVMHVIQSISRDYSQGRSLGDESEAYLMQYMVQEILQYTWRTNRSKSIRPK